ncbi:MAG: GGDEF domain-containing protein [Candidatus Levyibacteriota bacterium]|nr:MAG: GGDEF domain-containing protein [Candidatus Levybacteria bacterium]
MAERTELKLSKNPQITAAILEKRDELEKRQPNADIAYLHQRARDKVAAALVRQRLRDELHKAQELSMIDPLTGLKSRRWFDDELERRVKERESDRTKKPLFLIIMDYDNFKMANTQYGHPGGDAILRCMKTLNARETDEIARIGGEEFAQMIEGSLTPARIKQILIRYSYSLQGISEDLLNNRTPISTVPDDELMRRITCSFGVAQWIPGDTTESLFKRADIALDFAKRGGKNRGYIAQKNRRNFSFNEVIIPERPRI